MRYYLPTFLSHNMQIVDLVRAYNKEVQWREHGYVLQPLRNTCRFQQELVLVASCRAHHLLEWEMWQLKKLLNGYVVCLK